jgi:trehalose/maltose hydrolase-like predicted phosphorylase
VPIRTGKMQAHIVAQVAWAANCYVEWTGDDDFARGPGLTLLVETARYWCSRVRWHADGSAHIYGVMGPDEYHAPVDDNAFTNVMARWNLRRAAEAVETTPTGVIDVAADEVLAWRRTADALVDGYDAHTGIYEQFSGFGKLEPLVIEEFVKRRPIAADLLLGADRVRRTQVLKQADVLMLFHLLPDELVPETLEPNLRFYEPLTAHGSSLSPAIHASLFARARDYRRALHALHLAAQIDLQDLTTTSASGLHLAAMGGLWQALVFGFGGVRPRGGRLGIDPHLPPAWGGLELRLRFRGSRVHIRADRGELSVHAQPLAAVLVGGQPYTAGPAGVQFTRRGAKWEVIP